MKKKKLTQKIKSSFLLFFLLISCGKEEVIEVTFLDQLDGIVWTRGQNFKVFRSNPFQLFLEEDGQCILFGEGATMVNGNKFIYTQMESGADTLKLNYKVQGALVNHCGVFTYYFDYKQDLVREYEECNNFLVDPQKVIFSRSDQVFEAFCSTIN